ANPDAAFRLAAYLTTPESNAAWATATGNLPPGLDQATAWLAEQPAYAPFVAALDNALPWTGPPGFADGVEIANSVLAAAFDGDATVEDVRSRLEMLAAPPSPPGP
ncbi:MAG TPA: hypothetical protein VNK95_05950, partial [Caldilineaceae bacterium]|nr:hypothetical protein [Caldilineaceae bacterium]